MMLLKVRVRLAQLAALCLIASLVFGAPASAAEDQATCGGQPVTIFGAVQLAQNTHPNPLSLYQGPTIVGTEGDDVILGTNGAEWIRGLGGDDIICGLQGDDILTGGPGRDRLRGGAGNDSISGSDALEVGDVLRGGHGFDILAVHLVAGEVAGNVDLGPGGGTFVLLSNDCAGQTSCSGSGQWWF